MINPKLIEYVIKFLNKNKVVLDNGCWVLKNQSRKTYGQYAGKGIHKWSNFIFNNVDLKKFTLHKCDNLPCWNPDHLFGGDQSRNRADSIAKGRSPSLFGHALNETKITPCPKGHEYSKENTRVTSQHKRVCRICLKIRDIERNKGRVTINGIRYRRTALLKKGLV